MHHPEALRIHSSFQNDPVTMIRCLTMVSGLIQGVKCDVAFDPTLSVLLDDLVSQLRKFNRTFRWIIFKAIWPSQVTKTIRLAVDLIREEHIAPSGSHELPVFAIFTTRRLACS